MLTRFATDVCHHLDKGRLGWLMKGFYPLMPWLLKVPLHNGRRKNRESRGILVQPRSSITISEAGFPQQNGAHAVHAPHAPLALMVVVSEHG